MFQLLIAYVLIALTDNGKFLLAARKCRRTTCTDYVISLDGEEMSKGSNTYIGKLRWGLGKLILFLRTVFLLDLSYILWFFFFCKPWLFQ